MLTIGSSISLLGIIFLLFIIWKRIIANRQAIYLIQLNSSIEWYQNIPPAEHSYSELPLLTNF